MRRRLGAFGSGGLRVIRGSNSLVVWKNFALDSRELPDDVDEEVCTTSVKSSRQLKSDAQVEFVKVTSTIMMRNLHFMLKLFEDWVHERWINSTGSSKGKFFSQHLETPTYGRIFLAPALDPCELLGT